MTTYNTGNPIRSKDPRDLYDNAENFDVAVNNRTADFWTDRRGVQRQTWAGIERSGGIQGFATLADLQSSPGQSEGQLSYVTNDPDQERNGMYRWDLAGWEKSADRFQEKIDQLRGDSSNVYSDPTISNIALYGGDAAYVQSTIGTGAVSENLVRTIQSTEPRSILTPYSPIEGGGSYYFSLRTGRQYGDNETPVVEIYAIWNDRPLGDGDDFSESLIGINTESTYLHLEKQLAAPENARSVRLRVSKTNNANVGIGAHSIVIRRVADRASMVSEAFTPMHTLSRFIDNPTYLTNTIDHGLSELRPPFTDFNTYKASGGWVARVTTEVGVAARRELIYIDNFNGKNEYAYNVECNWSNRGTNIGFIRALDVGVAWYSGSKELIGEDLFLSLRRPGDTIGGGPNSERFSVGTVNSGADFTPPEGASYFSPFFRWEQDPLVLLITDLIVERQQRGGGSGGGGAPAKGGLTLTEAAALSPFERWRDEWFVVDGVVTHRDHLPPFSPQPLNVSMDFPAGDYSNATIVGGNEIQIISRGSSNFTWRYFCAKLTGMKGKNPLVTVNADTWNEPLGFSRWQLCWSDDIDSDNWRPFDELNFLSSENKYTGKNNKPFEVDTIFVSSVPIFSPERYRKKIKKWIASNLVRPTESAIDGFRIGTLPSQTSSRGKSSPDIDALAFKVGSGSKKFVITTGIHSDEGVGHYVAEGFLDALLSGNYEELTEKFTFYIYPNINAVGLYCGYYRRDPYTEQDMNRIWNRSYNSETVKLYESAFSIDIGSEPWGMLDFHSSPGTNPSSPAGPQPQVWRRTDVVSETFNQTYMDILHDYQEFRTVDSAAINTVTSYIRGLGETKMVLTIEYSHSIDYGVQDWREWGRNVCKALRDLARDFV